MKDKALRLFLVSAAFSTMLPLTAFWIRPAAGLSQMALAAIIVAASAVWLIASIVVSRILFREVAISGALPAASAVMGVCMTVSQPAAEPAFLLAGFVFGIAVAVFALMKNVDQLISPKLLMFVPMVQIMVIHFVIG